jgi:serine O-acetyltransferase
MAKIKSPFSIDKEKVYTIAWKTSHPSFTQKVITLIWHFELHCMAVYRFGQWSLRIYKKNKFIGILPVLIYFIFDLQMRLIHHVMIHRNATIGPGFHLGHSTNILIGPTTIGENCSVSNNVIIGVGLGHQEFETPVLGNNVWIGPGAVLTGKITIGNGSTISANALVSKDIPERCLVVGNPCRIIMQNYDNSNILGFKLDNMKPLNSDGEKG